jgi:hypothetical protein
MHKEMTVKANHRRIQSLLEGVLVRIIEWHIRPVKKIRDAVARAAGTQPSEPHPARAALVL